MIVNQTSLRGLNVSYSTAFNKAFQDTNVDWPKIAMEIPSATKENHYVWLGQFPHMREWIGEREIQKLAAYDYSIKNKPWEGTVAVPREDIEDDQYGIWTISFEQLGEAAKLQPEELVFSMLTKGFENAGYDGKSFFATNHPGSKEGQVFKNMTTLKLDENSFKAARAAMMSYTGDQDKSLNIVPNLLVVGPANEDMADWLLKAEMHNGSSNTLKGKADVLVSNQLVGDAADMWFLMDTKRRVKPLVFQNRRPAQIHAKVNPNDDNVFYQKTYVWGVDSRNNVGYAFWQMAYGSTGETASQG